MDRTVAAGRAKSPAQLLDWWRAERAALLDVAAGLDPKARIAWYGPPMGALSFLSARLMETWIHGQDVADALGVERQPTARLRHVAHIAVRARAFNYAQHGRPLPAGGGRGALKNTRSAADRPAPWPGGPAAAADGISGAALDSCPPPTQRRHIADTDLRVEGPLAAEWMAIAQAFAGPPGPGRRPGQ